MSLAVADGQGLLRIVPMERDGGVHALLVVVAVVLVFVQNEVSVGSAIDAQLNRIRRLLSGPLDVGAHGDD